MKSIPQLKKDFISTMNKLSYTRHKWRVWQDFNEMVALSISQSVNYTDDREAQYMRVVGRYEPEEVQLIPQLLGITTAALELQMCDFLGDIFQELELASKWHGQFFTPYPVCKMIAAMTMHDLKPFDSGKVVTISEPACGGGAMLIAACDHLLENGINYQRQLKITAMDVDSTACHMAYIQLSLLGCNAVVVHGNTLSLEEFNFFETPLRRLVPIHSEHTHEINTITTPLSTQTQLNHSFGTCTQINSKIS